VQLLRLNLFNFRSWENTEFKPGDGLNIICGGNAQGKSNLLEGIFFLATGKSYRTYRDRELAYQGRNSLAVGGQVRTTTGEFSLVLRWNEKEGKSFTLNREEQGRLADLFGHLTAVVFSPEDLAFIKGGPQLRRQALNLLLLQTSRPYYFHLREYNRILAQRNTFLKRLTPSKGNELLLLSWDEQLAESGAELMVRRQEALTIMKPWIKEYNYRLGSPKKLLVQYQPNINLAPGFDVQAAKNAFLEILSSNRRQEWRRGLTLSGPQRDEVLFLLDEAELRSFGSQGEQRTAALSWKLAETEYVRQRTGEYPLLLLDDVYSELDTKRRQFLTSEAARGTQSFITTTEKEIRPSGAAVWEVSLGKIQRIS
jgi:DNA replication and repair protein RecF